MARIISGFEKEEILRGVYWMRKEYSPAGAQKEGRLAGKNTTTTLTGGRKKEGDSYQKRGEKAVSVWRGRKARPPERKRAGMLCGEGGMTEKGSPGMENYRRQRGTGMRIFTEKEMNSWRKKHLRGGFRPSSEVICENSHMALADQGGRGDGGPIEIGKKTRNAKKWGKDK